MKRYRRCTATAVVFAACAAAAVAIGGCDNFFIPPAEQRAAARLTRFDSQEQLTEYVRTQIEARNVMMDRGSGTDDALVEEVTLGEGTDANNGAEPGVLPAPVADGGAGGAVDSDDSAAPPTDGFSQTTIQETGVDEADVVKTDGTYVYVISDQKLRIARAAPIDALALVDEVEIDGYGREIYLSGDLVVVLSETYGGFFGGLLPVDVGVVEAELLPVDATVVDVDATDSAGSGADSDSNAADDESSRDDGGVNGGQTTDADEPADAGQPDADGPEFVDDPGDGDDPASGDVAPAPDIEPDVRPNDGLIAPGAPMQFERPRTIVTVIDVSVPESAAVVSQTRFDGSMASSRMIDGVLHLVISNFQAYYYDVMPLLGTRSLDADTVEADMILPRYEQRIGAGDAVEGALVTWDDVYRPSNPDGFGVVSVVSMEVSDAAGMQAVGIVAEPGLVYSSREALYLTDTAYALTGQQREATDIFKLEYVDGGAVPVAAGSVPGRILNQYSMGEHDGYLRVATTVFDSGGFVFQPHNNVYVLDQVGDALETVGSVEDIAPRETIRSARFIGARGYVVTFEQIDPLFTLDLSDPSDPRIVGELKVPGFSSFIQPIDADHLLTVGTYIPEQDGLFRPWGVQLSIFDVTDFAAPVLAHQVVLGEADGAYSEALYNPKALTYFAQQGLVALPVEVYPEPAGVDDVIAVDGDVVIGDGAVVVGGGDTSVGAPPPATAPGPQSSGDGREEAGDDAMSSGGSAGDEGAPSAETDPPPDEPADGLPPEGVARGFQGLVVYRMSTETGFEELGRISTRSEQAYYYGVRFTRGVFLGNEVVAATDRGLSAKPMSALGTDAAPRRVQFESPELDNVPDIDDLEPRS